MSYFEGLVDCGKFWPHWRDDHDCFCLLVERHAGNHRCACGTRRVRFE